MAASSNPIIFVVGPTGAGKSKWALAEAVRTAGIILNADSIQLYKYLDIGSAKPTAEEMKRVPHFLFDFVDPLQGFTAGDYRRAAMAVIEQHIEKHPIYIVGGSGFYIQALDKGMYDIAPAPMAVLQELDQIKSQQELWLKLRELDMETAERIGPNDPYRTRRQLEIVMTVGKTIKQIESDFSIKQEPLSARYNVQKIGIRCARTELRARVTARVDNMLEQGLIEEVRTLLARGYGGTKALSSVGYRECVQYLSGQMDLADLKEKIVTSTMQLAKKQTTWFRRDSDIIWHE